MPRASTPPARRSGDLCKVSGLYACETHDAIRVMIFTGERFPLCVATRGHKTMWVGVEDSDIEDTGAEEEVPAAEHGAASGA